MRSNSHFFVLLDALRTANATKLYFCGVQKAVAGGFEDGYGAWLGGLCCALCNMARRNQLKDPGVARLGWWPEADKGTRAGSARV